MIAFRVDRFWNYIAKHIVIDTLLKALGQVVLAKLTEFVYCFFAIFRNVIEPLDNGKMSIHSLKVSVCWDKKKPLERGFFQLSISELFVLLNFFEFYISEVITTI